MFYTKIIPPAQDCEIITLVDGNFFQSYILSPQELWSYTFGVEDAEQREKNIRDMYAGILRKLRWEMKRYKQLEEE